MACKNTLYFALICLLILGGCSKNADDSLLSKALEDITGPLAQLNTRLFLMENALLTVQRYVNNPAEINLKEAKNVCTAAIVQITGLTSPVSVLTEDERAGLMRRGINMADYDAAFQYADYYKYENIKTLTLLLSYLSRAPSDDDTLEYVVDFNLRYLALDRKLEFIGLNITFCGVGGSRLESFKEDYLPGLATLCADNLPWETDSAALEAKAEYWFSKMEAEVGDYAEFVGEQYLSGLTDQAVLRESFEEAGFEPDKANKLISDIGALAQSAGYEP